MSIVERALKKIQDAAAQQVGNDAGAAEQRDAVAPRGRAAQSPVRANRTIAINRAALRNAGLLPPEHQERQIAQQYRQIKRPLLASALGRGVEPLPDGHLIQIASALAGEGKTFTSLNLALSMAREADSSVLLVDADVAKPQISRALGIEDQPGLLDLLRNPQADPADYIIDTDVPRLSVLPAGAPVENSTELLGGTRIQSLLETIAPAGSGHFVVFDSSPLLLTTEAQALAQVVGQVVVVVRAGVTTQPVLLDALSHLSGRAAVSLVLAQATTTPPPGYYNYYGEGRETAGQ